MNMYIPATLALNYLSCFIKKIVSEKLENEDKCFTTILNIKNNYLVNEA